MPDLEREAYFDSSPLPCLLVAFKEHDAIVACFDEEGQYMLEGSCEPTIDVTFSPNDPDQVRQVIRVVGRFVAVNAEVFRLAEEIQEYGEVA